MLNKTWVAPSASARPSPATIMPAAWYEIFLLAVHDNRNAAQRAGYRGGDLARF